MTLKGTTPTVEAPEAEEGRKASKKPNKAKKGKKPHPLAGRKRSKASIEKYKKTMAALREAKSAVGIPTRKGGPSLALSKKLGPIAMLRMSEQTWYDQLAAGQYGKARRLPWDIANAIAALRMMEGEGPK